MPDFTNRERFSLSMSEPVPQPVQDGWVEYDKSASGDSLQKREFKRGSANITQYRTVRNLE